MDEPVLNYATPTPGMPAGLKVVAWLFIAGGVLAILHILVDLTNSRITLNTGVLGVFIGPGLMRFSKGWRTCALVLLWIGMIFSPLVLLYMSQRGGWIDVDVLGFPVGKQPMGVALLVGALMFAVTVWEYRVLVREDVRERFGVG